jgi:cobaltochelatase CobS
MTPTKEVTPTGTWQTLIDGIQRDVEDKIESAIAGKVVQIHKLLEEMDRQLRDNTAALDVRIGDATHRVEGARHKQLDQLITIAAQRLPVLLVGSAGTGKSHSAEQVSEALGLPFKAMSVGGQTSKSDILGFMHAGGDYVKTHFRDAYEHGGVFLMDEIDAGNANVLIQVNAALSNDYCAFPDQMVKRHDDFIFIASANTFGNGANRQYVGRNQLDAATLDRFVILDWEIDEALEAMFAGTNKDAKKWHDAVKAVRKAVADEGMRVLVTPRATIRGASLLAAGIPFEQAADLSLYNLFPADKQGWARGIGMTAAKKLP